MKHRTLLGLLPTGLGNPVQGMPLQGAQLSGSGFRQPPRLWPRGFLAGRQDGDRIQPTCLAKPPSSHVCCTVVCLPPLSAQQRTWAPGAFQASSLHPGAAWLPVWEKCSFHGRAAQLSADSFSQLLPPPLSSGDREPDPSLAPSESKPESESIKFFSCLI